CLVVQRGDEVGHTLGAESGRKISTLRGKFADSAAEVDIADLCTVAVDHQIVEGDPLTVSFDDLRLDDGAVSRGLLSNDFQPLAGVFNKALSINRRDVSLESLHDLLALLVR